MFGNLSLTAAPAVMVISVYKFMLHEPFAIHLA